jgi:hypothetical protein
MIWGYPHFRKPPHRSNMIKYRVNQAGSGFSRFKSTMSASMHWAQDIFQTLESSSGRSPLAAACHGLELPPPCGQAQVTPQPRPCTRVKIWRPMEAPARQLSPGANDWELRSPKLSQECTTQLMCFAPAVLRCPVNIKTWSTLYPKHQGSIKSANFQSLPKPLEPKNWGPWGCFKFQTWQINGVPTRWTWVKICGFAGP